MAEILFFGYGAILLVGFSVAIYAAWKKLPKDSSACTGDCNQGRNCTCCCPTKGVTKDVE